MAIPASEGDPEPVAIVPPSDQKTSEWITALAAADIDYSLAVAGERWIITFTPDVTAAARTEIREYEEANRDWPPRETSAPPPRGPVSWSPWWVAGFLAAFYIWLGPYTGRSAVLAAAAMERSAVTHGEWWRLVTALTVHADAGHLAGNMFSIGLFGLAVCSLVGPGVAWTAILLAGIGGNALAVAVQSHAGVSVGASTACFGAVGILCGYRFAGMLRDRPPPLSLSRGMWLTAGGGLALLALLGTGPNSDLAAHAGGFACGILLGMPLVYAAEAKPRPAWQRLLEILCLCAVMLCWRLAFRAA